MEQPAPQSGEPGKSPESPKTLTEFWISLIPKNKWRIPVLLGITVSVGFLSLAPLLVQVWEKWPSNPSKPAGIISGPQPSPNSTSASDPNAETVYITKTGAKYHRSTCQFAKIPISLGEAKARHYEPCKLCWARGR